jgi:hypothetical protein
MSRKRIEDVDLREIELDRVVTIRQAAKLAGVSERTLRDTRADKIIRISPGRIGMRVRDALLIAEKAKNP